MIFFCIDHHPELVVFHQRKAMNQLNRNLSNKNLQTGDTTIAAIIGLSLASFFSVDFATSPVHIEGLRDIVHCRRGIKIFINSRHLLV